MLYKILSLEYSNIGYECVVSSCRNPLSLRYFKFFFNVLNLYFLIIVSCKLIKRNYFRIFEHKNEINKNLHSIVRGSTLGDKFTVTFLKD